jgi:hypothetical protein
VVCFVVCLVVFGFSTTAAPARLPKSAIGFTAVLLLALARIG